MIRGLTLPFKRSPTWNAASFAFNSCFFVAALIVEKPLRVIRSTPSSKSPFMLIKRLTEDLFRHRQAGRLLQNSDDRIEMFFEKF